MRRHNAMMFNYFKKNLFKATLTPELRAIVTQQVPETIKKMYWVTTTAQREGKGKNMASNSEVREDEIPA